VSDAPASYSSAQKNSWAPAHELLHSLPMLLYNCLCLPAGILHWVVLPLHQVFKILFPPGLLPTLLSSMHSICGFCATGNCFCHWITGSSTVPAPASFVLYGYKSEILKIGDIPMPSGNSSSYAFSPNFLRILAWPDLLHLELVVCSPWEPFFPQVRQNHVPNFKLKLSLPLIGSALVFLVGFLQPLLHLCVKFLHCLSEFFSSRAACLSLFWLPELRHSSRLCPIQNLKWALTCTSIH
jgi:hypothetical protein